MVTYSMHVKHTLSRESFSILKQHATGIDKHLFSVNICRLSFTKIKEKYAHICKIIYNPVSIYIERYYPDGI